MVRVHFPFCLWTNIDKNTNKQTEQPYFKLNKLLKKKYLDEGSTKTVLFSTQCFSGVINAILNLSSIRIIQTICHNKMIFNLIFY